jgi:hypothetical protein
MKTLVVLAPIMQNLGAFKIPLITVSLLVLVLIILLIFDTFVIKGINDERRKQSMQALLVLGSMNAALGMLGQIMGIWYALAAILQAADISPAIVIEGLQASFGTTYFGFITFIVAFVFWLVFQYVPVARDQKS